MPSPPIAPCLWLDDPAGRPRGSVLTVELELAGRRFTVLDGGPAFALDPGVSSFAHLDSPTDADRLRAPLAEGGGALMPLGAHPWSERHGRVQDRFGVSWQVVPDGIAAWRASPDAAARDRALAGR